MNFDLLFFSKANLQDSSKSIPATTSKPCLTSQWVKPQTQQNKSITFTEQFIHNLIRKIILNATIFLLHHHLFLASSQISYAVSIYPIRIENLIRFLMTECNSDTPGNKKKILNTPISDFLKTLMTVYHHESLHHDEFF